MIYIILLIAAAAAGAFIYKKKQAPAPRTQAPARKPPPKFASVELRPGKHPCSAARAMIGQQILASEAAPLPLHKCTQVTCNCSYRKLDDRRQEDTRRSSDIGIEPMLYSGNESRQTSDRRDLW